MTTIAPQTTPASSRLGTTVLLTLAASLHAGNFEIQIDDLVAENVPGPGAGVIAAVDETDVYTFAGEENQAVFFEELGAAAAFKGWLRWEVKSPSGRNVMSSYLTDSHEGRHQLPETGAYTLTVRVGAKDPSYVGSYSFRVRGIPPDPTFAIQLGDTIANNQPAAGAGNIEAPGAQEFYTFHADAGQIVYADDLGAAPAFKGWLTWELRAPSGASVFRGYLDGRPEGRKTLPETGTYTLKTMVGANETSYLGTYSFRLRPIAGDQTFALTMGDTVSDGVPAAGAGNLEDSGAQDFYTFSGTAGQALFFESIEAASSLGGWLAWELKAPGGQTVFSSFLLGSSGRKTLPETGTYTLRLWVNIHDPELVGTYSFRVSETTSDTGYEIQIGHHVSDGVPGAGAGNLETPGAEDHYTFEGTAGLNVIFQPIEVSPAFDGWLRWELRSPTDESIFAQYFRGDAPQRVRLPNSGTYRIKVSSGLGNPSHVGTYAFRAYAEVFANPNTAATPPGVPLALPFTGLLCNDRHEAADEVWIELPSINSAEGGTLATTATGIQYTPKSGFTGTDHFEYRLSGRFGGEDVTTVTLNVKEGADRSLSVLCLTRLEANTVQVLLLGIPDQTYRIEHSIDLTNWSPAGTMTANAQGTINFGYLSVPGPTEYYRFLR